MKNNTKQLALFNVVEKIESSTATITELRIPIFSPVLKLSGNSVTAREFKKNGGIRTIETSWGKVEIRGRKLLTQVHRDLLDCIYTHASKVLPLPTGEVVLVFSQTKILKEYSRDSKSSHWENQTKWLKEKIKEIRDITVNYVDTKGNSFDFNLISHLDYLEEHKAYSITLDNRYLKFYERELSINYKKELTKLLQVDSALTKAIIRWFFTHKKESRFKLMTVLQALGFPIDSPKSLQVCKRTIKNEVGQFQSFGIDYNPSEEMFYYRGNTAVGFIPSLFNQKNQLIHRKPLIAKKTLKDLIAMKIYLDEIEVIIKSISYETEGALIIAAYIETENNKNFRIKNKEELDEENFELEVILYLESIFYKE
ncbi:MAG: hypothetical protein DRQ78_13025 [Epsilonproteobacteria bacterium]|nr:MAG: hypothetical protein DRQ78_13025 [Campylobacterota bacterium]